MQKVLSEIRARKLFLIPIVAVVVFLIIRTIILQKPSTDIPYTVKREDLVDTVQVSGTYTTASQTMVSSPANGIISQLYVTNGEVVRKGDPLFHVDSTATTDQQNAAYTDYTSALSALQTAVTAKQTDQSTLEKDRQAIIDAQESYNLTVQLYGGTKTNPSTGTAYTQTDVDSAQSKLTSARETFSADETKYTHDDTAITAAQAKVTQTKRLYDETKSATVYATANGKVVNLQDRVGDSVSAPSTAITIAGNATGQAAISSVTPQPVLVIANLSDPYISTNIGEDYATRVMSGQLVSVVFDAMRNETFPGRVEDIATVGTNMQGIVTYAARIQTSALPTVIKPSMTALVTIETLRRDNVIDIPNSAIVSKDGSTYVLAANTHKQIPVTLGEKGVAKTEVSSGLDEGMVIVANPD
jgi:HlyD family secretion protein